jgi:hypothetical protein
VASPSAAVERPHQFLINVRFGSWSCENAVAKALTRRDFGEVAVLGHFAEFGGFSVWKCF